MKRTISLVEFGLQKLTFQFRLGKVKDIRAPRGKYPKGIGPAILEPLGWKKYQKIKNEIVYSIDEKI